jgi:pSer/pThr/pTyr-binding forkhead associated (FHA) protein
VVDPRGSPRAVSAAELKAQIDAEREGLPFLVYRDGDGERRIFRLTLEASRATLGRRETNDVSLTWDQDVSRLHATLERVGEDWLLADDGVSRNGSFVNGERVSGRRRLCDGDTLRLGETVMTFRRPAPPRAESRATNPSAGVPAAATLSRAQRRVLVALSRPFKDAGTFGKPATNQEIAQELFLSVDAVKTHLRLLFQKFDVEHLPQNEKRLRLVERALQSGLISERDL